MTEDEMVGQHHLLNGHEFEQVLGVGDAVQPSHPLSSTLFLPSIFPSIKVFSNMKIHIKKLEIGHFMDAGCARASRNARWEVGWEDLT